MYYFKRYQESHNFYSLTSYFQYVKSWKLVTVYNKLIWTVFRFWGYFQYSPIFSSDTSSGSATDFTHSILGLRFKFEKLNLRVDCSAIFCLPSTGNEIDSLLYLFAVKTEGWRRLIQQLQIDEYFSIDVNKTTLTKNNPKSFK